MKIKRDKTNSPTEKLVEFDKLDLNSEGSDVDSDDSTLDSDSSDFPESQDESLSGSIDMDEIRKIGEERLKREEE